MIPLAIRYDSFVTEITDEWLEICFYTKWEILKHNNNNKSNIIKALIKFIYCISNLFIWLIVKLNNGSKIYPHAWKQFWWSYSIMWTIKWQKQWLRSIELNSFDFVHFHLWMKNWNKPMILLSLAFHTAKPNEKCFEIYTIFCLFFFCRWNRHLSYDNRRLQP